MIYGICTSMKLSNPEDIGLDNVKYFREIGLDYLELPVDRLMRCDNNAFEKLKKDLSESNIPCLACNNFIDGSVKLSGREYDKNVFENYINKALERISSVGAKKVVLGSSRARNTPSYLSAEEGRKQVIDRIIYIAGIAEKLGLELEIEHLNRMESNVFNTFEETSALAKQLNRPNVKSIFDSYHFGISGESLDLIKQNEKWIGHIHFACTLGRLMPDLDEAKKLLPLFKAIGETSYNDTFSLEANFPSYDPQYREVMDYIKSSIGKQ